MAIVSPNHPNQGQLDVPLPTYPYGKYLYKPYIVGIDGYNPQESLENTS